MNKKKLFFQILFIITGLITIQACTTYYFRNNYKDANSLIHQTADLKVKLFLKAHMKNGDVCILKDSWSVDTLQSLVMGNGTRYEFNRNMIYQGTMSIPVDSVALFETNEKIETETGRIAALSILAGVDLVVGIICLTNPKACFGSCPTFYLNEKDNFHYADAEGFSSAILPSMEYFDIDALNNKPITDHSFSITMKNEALETHCVNDVKLLACPRKEGQRIYQSSSNDFYLCENNYKINKATGTEGEITKLLESDDKQERFSLADENNLSTKEEVYLNFEGVKNQNDLGIIINFRQTLLTTYLFYSAMGYMGENVGDIFSLLETNKKFRNDFDATTKELGNIEVYIWNEKKAVWEFQDMLNETGPIAVNRQIVPLTSKATGPEVKIKLVMNKGLWRIDYAALTNIRKEIKPVELSPVCILNKGKTDNSALHLINDTEKYLVSMPGSEYKFNFVLPGNNNDYELFLYSKGYYLEWMRASWLKDKDMSKLMEMVFNPKGYLKSETKNYKRYENYIEQEFWNSKIDTKTFSYNEN